MGITGGLSAIQMQGLVRSAAVFNGGEPMSVKQISKQILMLSLIFMQTAIAGDTPAGNPRISLGTSGGVINNQLFPEKTPAPCNNFLSYLDKGFLEGAVFHRVISKFMDPGG